MYQHLKIANSDNVTRNKNPHLYNKISKLLSNGGHIIYEIVFRTDNELEAYNEEKKFINEIGIENLTNISDGGLGGLIGEWNSERKNKLSNSKKGKPRSEKTKEKISKSLKGKSTGRAYWKGKTLSDETKEKMRKSSKGKNKGPITDKRRIAIIEGIRRKREREALSLDSK
jgi:hypothetical protein